MGQNVTLFQTAKQLVHRAEIINASEPDVIIGGGEYLSLTPASTAQDAETQWGLYLAMFDALKPPVLQALGNHDMARSSPEARIEFRKRLRPSSQGAILLFCNRSQVRTRTPHSKIAIC